MGLLDKLWDDIVAGPQPENGLGKLRKSATMGTASSPEVEETVRRISDRRSSAEDAARITHSISIVKPTYLRSLSVDTSDSPSSPSNSSPPSSPSVTPREKESAWRSIHSNRNKAAAKKKVPSETYDKAEPRSPTVYDWVVISALDR